MAGGFQGKEGQQIPEMTPEFVDSVTERYIELYEKVSGEEFNKDASVNVLERINDNVSAFLKDYYS